MRSSLGAPHSTEHCKDSVFFAFLQVFCAVFFIHRSFCSICGKRISNLSGAIALALSSTRTLQHNQYKAKSMRKTLLTIESRTADN